ncbi:hypothetical protein DITRI_Ditri14bG0055000 [Diplodiscus trichospermus]
MRKVFEDDRITQRGLSLLETSWEGIAMHAKRKKEASHLYERRELPYPGDAEAIEDFVAKEDWLEFGTTIGPKWISETNNDSFNYQKVMQKKKFEQEAMKLLLRFTALGLRLFQSFRIKGVMLSK